MSDTRVQAAVYARISKDRTGAGMGVGEQVRLCRAKAAALGLNVIEPPFTDNDMTAAKGNSRSRRRPGYEALLSAIADRKVTAVIAWHTDRIHRNTSELEHYINICGEGASGVPTYTVIGGDLDLSTASGRMVAKILGAVAQGEVEHAIERMKAAHERRRRQGIARAGGPAGRCYGFHTDGLTHRIDETAIIRQAAAAVLAGQGLAAIAGQLASEGVTTTSGKPMHIIALKRILTYPRMAGLMPDGVSAAAWEPVLERADWEEVRAILSLNKAFPNQGRGALHLLSGIAKCGADGCGHPLWSGRNAGGPAYRCAACGRVGRSMKLLDAFVAEAVIAQLGRGDNPRGRTPESPGLAAEFAALTAARAELETVIADPARGTIPALLERWDRLNKRLEELRALAGDDARARLRAGHAGISYEEFMAEPLPVRRSLADACFSIVVLPSSRRGPGFRAEDVRLTPR